MVAVPMRRALHHWLLIGTLTLAVGFHWPVLQGAAWAGMFLSRVRSQPVGEALKSTFSGHSPCRVCRLVASSRSTETSPEAATIDLRQLEARGWSGTVAAFEAPRLAPLVHFAARLPGARPQAPPVPPPRRLAA